MPSANNVILSARAQARATLEIRYPNPCSRNWSGTESGGYQQRYSSGKGTATPMQATRSLRPNGPRHDEPGTPCCARPGPSCDRLRGGERGNFNDRAFAERRRPSCLQQHGWRGPYGAQVQAALDRRCGYKREAAPLYSALVVATALGVAPDQKGRCLCQ